MKDSAVFLRWSVVKESFSAGRWHRKVPIRQRLCLLGTVVLLVDTLPASLNYQSGARVRQDIGSRHPRVHVFPCPFSLNNYFDLVVFIQQALDTVGLELPFLTSWIGGLLIWAAENELSRVTQVNTPCTSDVPQSYSMEIPVLKSHHEP